MTSFVHNLTRACAAVTTRGDQLVTGLRAALAGSPHVKEVRGAGLLVGIELDVMAGPVVEVRGCFNAVSRIATSLSDDALLGRRAVPRGC
jgi:acetylornithine/succinyldiaminopimelate/putrescine aminotransferase